ncbi:YoaK family protein [Streptomyces uncialis]|uniref:YoaK family protein n=1 Tax=Streptomyces uncialis TaxID=1048205 RepID=UPI0037FF0EA0
MMRNQPSGPPDDLPGPQGHADTANPRNPEDPTGPTGSAGVDRRGDSSGSGPERSGPDAAPEVAPGTAPDTVPDTASVLPATAGRQRLADALALLLTVAAGATDALAYLGLGGVFTANMTGNLVLLGIAGSHGADLHVARAAAATLAFAAGLVLAFRVTRDLPAGALWPRRITLTLTVGLLCQVAFLAGWAAVDAEPSEEWDVALVALSALAMGVQTACARRVALAGITTTFVTGTLTSIAESAAHGSARHVPRRLAVLLALVVGALAGALLLRYAPITAAVLPAALVALTLVLGTRLHQVRRNP